MPHPSPKHLVFEQFSVVGKALGNRHRLELLDVLMHGERNVETLAAACGLTIGNVSQHLRQLHHAGLVNNRREGKQVIYSLADARIVQLLRTLWDIAESNVAEIESLLRRFYQDRDSLDPVTRDELLERMDEGAVLILDVRPAEEYRAGHVPGAVNVPVAELEQRLAELPRDQPIVACCRGRYCVYAYEAVEVLRDHGFCARRLKGGFLEWMATGQPVARPAETDSTGP